VHKPTDSQFKGGDLGISGTNSQASCFVNGALYHKLGGGGGGGGGWGGGGRLSVKEVATAGKKNYIAKLNTFQPWVPAKSKTLGRVYERDQNSRGSNSKKKKINRKVSRGESRGQNQFLRGNEGWKKNKDFIHTTQTQQKTQKKKPQPHHPHTKTELKSRRTNTVLRRWGEKTENSRPGG